jgi:hypothetical protein
MLECKRFANIVITSIKRSTSVFFSQEFRRKLHLLVSTIIRPMNDCLFSFSSFPRAYRTDYDNTTKWMDISICMCVCVKSRTDKKLHQRRKKRQKKEIYVRSYSYRNTRKERKTSDRDSC